MSHCGVFRIRTLIAHKILHSCFLPCAASATRLEIIIPLEILWSGIPWTEPARLVGICGGRLQPQPSYR